MAQLLENLARRRAALRRRAGNECMTARPRGEIQQRAGERRPLGRRGGCLRPRVVDRWHDPEDVHRHVDPARDGGHLRRLQPAPGVGAIGEDHDRAPPALAGADPLRGFRNRIVERRRPERDNRRHRLGQRLQTGRERLHFVESRVEGEDRRFVATIEPAQNMGRCLARVGETPFHAAADVEEQGDTDAGGVGTEIRDGAWPPAVEHLEIVRRQIAHEPALVVAHHSCDADDINAGLERGHRWLLREQFACQSKDQTCKG
jgi:hypothetical protein